MLYLNKILIVFSFSCNSNRRHTTGHFTPGPRLILSVEGFTFHALGSPFEYMGLCRVGSVGSMSASRTVGREFAYRPGHTKDHHKNGTNCLPAWHAMR